MIKSKHIKALIFVVGMANTVHAGLSTAARKAATAVFHTTSRCSLISKHLLHQFGDIGSLKEYVETGFASLQNVRDNGECAAYPNQDRAVAGVLRKNMFFGVFDGHGILGDKIADLLQKELVRRVLLSKEPSASFKKSFTDMQELLCKLPDAQRAGATAVVALIEEGVRLTLAHIGDSRAVVVRNGKVIHTTADHKPTNLVEKERIEKQGGFVVNGRSVDPVHRVSYALARSMGDVSAQGCALSAEPEIAESLILQKGDMVVLATDGVWDVLSNEDIASYVSTEMTAQLLAETFVNEARGHKSADDITAFVILVK